MKKKHIAIILLVAVMAVLLSLWGYSAYQKHQRELAHQAYLESHVFIEDAVYPKDSLRLDLRGESISVEHYDALKAALPDCEILWNIPFQGSTVPCDTTELSITSLTDEDFALLDYLPCLEEIHAESCQDYPQLMALRERHPEYTVTYQVTLSGNAYSESTTGLTFTEADPAELQEKLQYLPELKTIHFVQPDMAAQDLLALRDSYPSVSITWEKDVFGTTCTDDVTELDFSGMTLESLDEVEAAMAYFPDLEKLILCDCGIDNETMAAYRERAREDYKVVWSVMIHTLAVRTDELTFMPVRHDLYVTDAQLQDLVYCEDMLCVDLGHRKVRDIDWIYGMPHLQYLILADSWVDDITPIGTLKELIYLELFKSNVSDYSPLLGCTALEDVNLAFTSGDASVFAEMPWLKNLWINQCHVDNETRQLLIESLPNTKIEFDHGWHMGNSWRGLENYFRMRDLLDAPYYDWGNTTGRPEWADDTGRERFT